MTVSRRARALRISVFEGMLHAVMLGVAESYLGAFAVELGHRDTALALLATFPVLAGAVAQLAAGPLSAWLGARKRLVVAGAAIQAVSHIGFAAIAWTGSDSLALLLAVKTLYWGSGLIVGPPWGAWMAELIRGPARERYFAWRSSGAQLALLVAYVAAGIALHGAGALDLPVLWVFAILSTVGFVARVSSAACLAAQADPGRSARARYDARAVWQGLSRSEWRAAWYVAALMLGAHVAVPFFTPYMLRELGFDYGTYTALTALPIVIKAATLPALFRVASRLGMRRLFAGSVVAIASVALAWSTSTSLAVLAGAQILSGIAWAGFEYASFQLLLQSAPARSRVEFLSVATTISSAAQLAGALVGGQLLGANVLDYREIILLSAVLRLLPAGLAFVIVPRRMLALPRLAWKLVSVRPSGGTVQRPVLPADPDNGRTERP